MAVDTGKVTIYTIAKELGVSIATVSRAFDPDAPLKPAKRQIVLETAERLGYVPNKMASRLSSKSIRIGALIYGYITAYSNEYLAGIRDAYAEFVDYKVDLDLHFLDAWKDSIDDAYAVLDSFIETKCEGVIIGGLCRAPHLAKLNELADAGIQLIILDTDLHGCRRNGVSMNDFTTAGRMAAQLLRCAMGSAGNVAVFTGSMDNLSQQGLVNVFGEASAAYGNRVVATYHTENSAELAEQAVRGMLTAFPAISGIYISTANSIPICRTLEEAGMAGKISVIASDVFTELNRYIRNGTVFATIYQNPFSQARAAFEALFFNILDKVPIPEFTLSQPQAVFESNLNLYEK